MSYYIYIDAETRETIRVCNYSNLSRAAKKKAIAHLYNAYGEDEDTPDFELMSFGELNEWAESLAGLYFEPESGFLRWDDAAARITPVSELPRFTVETVSYTEDLDHHTAQVFEDIFSGDSCLEANEAYAAAILRAVQLNEYPHINSVRIMECNTDGTQSFYRYTSGMWFCTEWINRHYIITGAPIETENSPTGSTFRHLGLHDIPYAVLQPYPYTFRLRDADGEVYFYGASRTNDDDMAFLPLDRIGRDWGCTEIQYWNAATKEWENL